MKFTEQELNMLHMAIIASQNSLCESYRVIAGGDTKEAIKAELQRYTELNNKICSLMEG